MNTAYRWFGVALLVALVIAPGLQPGPATAATAAEIDRDASAALGKLVDSTPKGREVARVAKGILVFPSVAKACFVVGGLFGEGALRMGTKTVGYYNTVAAPYGL